MLRFASKRILGVSREVPLPTLQVLPQFSAEKVDRYNNQRSVSSFDKNNPMGLARAPACGDDMKLHINGDAMTRKTVDACFKTFGCGLGAASSSAGKQMEGVSSIKIMDIGMTPMSFHPLKLQRFMFAEDANKAGVKSYEAKRTLATASEATSGDTAATPIMAAGNRLRPISPHLSIYKPQSSSMTSIFNRISGSILAAMVLGFYVLCMKMPLICYSYAEFYQFFHFSTNFSTIFAQIAAVAMSYHLYEGIKRLAHV